MRRIDIFISSLEDVQIRRSLAERLILSTSAEFGGPVRVSYSNAARRLKQEDAIIAQRGMPGGTVPYCCAHVSGNIKIYKRKKSGTHAEYGPSNRTSFRAMSCADSFLYDNDLGYSLS
jgi:hypothetical protein